VLYLLSFQYLNLSSQEKPRRDCGKLAFQAKPEGVGRMWTRRAGLPVGCGKPAFGFPWPIHGLSMPEQSGRMGRSGQRMRVTDSAWTIHSNPRKRWIFVFSAKSAMPYYRSFLKDR